MSVTQIRARNSDPGTSHAAARSVSGTEHVRAAILSILGRYGNLTDEEIALIYGNRAPEVSPSGLRTRRAELVARGLVVDTGKRAATVSGRKAIVWGLA